jgi:hypothetical protein
LLLDFSFGDFSLLEVEELDGISDWVLLWTVFAFGIDACWVLYKLATIFALRLLQVKNSAEKGCLLLPRHLHRDYSVVIIH